MLSFAFTTTVTVAEYPGGSDRPRNFSPPIAMYTVMKSNFGAEFQKRIKANEKQFDDMVGFKADNEPIPFLPLHRFFAFTLWHELLHRVVLIGVTLAAQSQGISQSYTFETFSVTGAWHTVATAINNHGQIVGTSQSPPNATPVGFLRDSNGITQIEVPGAGPLNGTVASGINDEGTIVGSYVTEDGKVTSHGFILRSGIFTTFDVPDSQSTRSGKINNAGKIAGSWSAAGPGDRIGRGFIKDQDSFTFLDYPGLPETQVIGGTGLAGINDSGDAVGGVQTDTVYKSFLYRSNTFTFIEVPVGIDTAAYGVNNHGQIVGSFRDQRGQHGFLTISNRFFEVNVPGIEPGPFGTTVLGINDLGQIVGSIWRAGFPPPAQLGFVAYPCHDGSTNCITLPEIIRPPPPPLWIKCPDDWVTPCDAAAQPEERLWFSVTAGYEGGPAATVTCDPPPGSLFPFGTTYVRCTAKDDRGNETNCQFSITRPRYEYGGLLPPLRRKDQSGGSFSAPVRTVPLRRPLPVRFTTTCLPYDASIRLIATKYSSANQASESYYCAATDGAGEFKPVDGAMEFLVDLQGSHMSPGIWRLSFRTPDGEHEVWIKVRPPVRRILPGISYWPAMPPRTAGLRR